ncbi:MAG TPA: D-alanyl-D-alanine carboxypeptidase [Clostridiales bacterium]|nr:D-alanyl-D-alanine carboxypeptidase [Clostridiales bacterium]
MLKNVKIILVTLLLIVYTNISVFADTNAPQSSGKAAVLMDGASGRILYEKNAYERLPMASTTKIMTAIVALEYGRLDDKVTIPPEASGIEGSSIWLSAGETHTLEDLLYALMLRSGNDAATAIALHIGGSIEGFAGMMNKTAKKIGAHNTHFVNPHGLHHDDHYTTAYDLALITAYGLKNPVFEKIVSTRYHTMPWEGHKWDRAMMNKNKLLWSFEGANGVKTGYTKKAGRCFVGSAKRDNLQLIAVVLNCGPMFEESAALLDYGFKNYKNIDLVEKGREIKKVPVRKGKQDSVALIAGDSYSMALKETEFEKVRTEEDVPNELQAPVTEGEKVGSIKIYFNDNYLYEVPVVIGQTVEKRTFWDFVRRMVNIWR